MSAEPYCYHDGRNVVAVYLEAAPPKRQGLDEQRKWAESVGGQLITCAIAAMLASTLGDLLPPEWVWAEDDRATPDCEWQCYLRSGRRDCPRSPRAGAAAVLLIPLVDNVPPQGCQSAAPRLTPAHPPRA